MTPNRRNRTFGSSVIWFGHVQRMLIKSWGHGQRDQLHQRAELLVFRPCGMAAFDDEDALGLSRRMPCVLRMQMRLHAVQGVPASIQRG